MCSLFVSWSLFSDLSVLACLCPLNGHPIVSVYDLVGAATMFFYLQ